MGNSSDKIVLVGLPGSGKSTLGKRLSLSLQYAFYDLDDLITKSIGKSIAQFFKEEGEESFRLKESTILHKCLVQDGAMVLSTGGGAPCFFDNMDIINRNSTSVYIDVPEKILMKRLLNNGGGERPMFFNLSEEEILTKVLTLKESREKFYNQAKIKLSGENISAELILSELRGFRS